MKGDSAGEESQIQVRVRNTETKLVCMWTLAKTKERLQKMRKLMYAVSRRSFCYLVHFFA